ncbi:MAG: RNA polymerase sigma factor (sigma-70 family) [Polaribacter sp.]|jgi:RNA polymerase sigma factor (sigma-70 family)
MHQNDPQLIQMIQAGDRAANTQLYERYESYWFRICLRYGRNRSEAQDIFQEGAVRLFQVLDKFDLERGAFKSWSSKVIVNAALNYLKKHQWQQSFEDLKMAEGKIDGSENTLEKLSAKELIEVIQKLPSGYRVVFNMHEIEGYTHHEIAVAMNITVGTSKSQLSKAKKMLRQKLSLLF